ncbi:UDP-3-O-(3-hydroxymyristoyl)glucosamine N-acyltransferase [Planctomycetota bacterium]
MELTVGQLAERIGAELVGDGFAVIDGVGPVESCGQNDVTFVTNDKHLSKLESSCAGAVIVGSAVEGLSMPQLVVKNVTAALIEALKIFAPVLAGPVEGVDPTAKIGKDVKIGSGVSIGAFVVIDDKVEIGDGSVISSGCRIGENSKLGNNCRLDSNVVVYHNCFLGNNVIIQANTAIGGTGFGYSFIDGEHRLIPHNGGVVIEDFVEIGANCCVDRGKFGNTVIGAGTKMDNLVQIAHNAVIGKCCLMAGHAGISGSCKIGDGVVIAGHAGTVDNITVGDRTVIGALSAVTHDVGADQQLFGMPATDLKEQLKSIGLSRRLPKLFEQLRQLKGKVKRLEASKDDKE